MAQSLVEAVPVVEEGLAAAAQGGAVEREGDALLDPGACVGVRMQAEGQDRVGDDLLGAVQVVADAGGDQVERGRRRVELMDRGEPAALRAGR